ncbi:MAG TPA: Gfo/Idh/MocA family oxidoreductase [Terriglobia bacterium]|jgi:predicted dehydrogenase|nr:Gfo/Idh/MocA family oxidoreductase [Terriglobia bacterium]
MDQKANKSSVSRRKFLQGSVVVAGSALTTKALFARGSVGAADLLRIGLIGCGGRGTGAAAQALAADPNVKLVAMGDAFIDHVENSLAKLKADPKIAGKIDVPAERRFSGFDNYQKVLESGIDVVLLAEPPHFRPKHLKAAIEAGKHVFAEKPVAVDAPGVRSVLATCEEARKKGLSVVSGLCLRYAHGFREAVQRIHDGAIGEIASVQASDFRGPIWVRARQPGWSDLEYQVRNWYYFSWLSGDFIVEQHVHFLDVCSWIMKDQYPVKAIGTGGRQVRTGPDYGNIYDHHSIIYEYANGAKLYGFCRQQSGCHNETGAFAMGTEGRAEISQQRQTISGKNSWKYDGPKNNFYQTEHDELFASIRSGKPIDNSDYMSKTTLLAIMGRTASYTGQVVTWEQVMNSKEDFTLSKYEWGPFPEPSVAMPGEKVG